MRAELIEYQKFSLSDGSTIEVKVWRLPAPTRERPHGLKHSLFYGRPGERLVGYDNETRKGDHRHYRGREEPYKFSTFEALLEDFWAAVGKEIAG